MSRYSRKDKMKVGNKIIGEGRVFIIAEAGINHNGSLEKAKRLVDAAKDAQVDAVKFQTYKTESLVSKGTEMAEYQKKNTGKTESQLSMLRRLELSNQEFEELKEYCDHKGMMFLSTPHTEDSVDFLDNIVPLFKIGSGDLTNLPLLKKVARKGKPVIISTGMANIEEVRDAIEAIKVHNNQIIILHCTTNYPCPKDQANLSAMNTLKKEFGYIVGYSDHTEGIDVSVMAASLGAEVIEKHFTLDKNDAGPDHKASLNPEELSEMTEKIRSGKRIDIPPEILGSGKKFPVGDEIEIAKVARKSIVAKEDIKKGEVIKEEMLTIKRPGTGISPKYLEKVIGKVSSRNIRKDTLILWGDIR